MNSIDINAYHPFMGGLENDVIVVPRDSYCPCFTYIILHRRWHVFPFPFFRGLLSVAQHLGSPAPDMRYSEVQCHRRPQVDSQTQGMHTTDPDDDDCHLFFFFFFLLMSIVHLFLLSWFYFFYGTFPFKQPFGVYESRVDIPTYQPNLFHHFIFHLNRPKPPRVLCFLLNRVTTTIHRSGARPNASRCITSSNYIDIFHSIPRQTYGTFFLSPT